MLFRIKTCFPLESLETETILLTNFPAKIFSILIFRSILAIIAVVTVDTPVQCMRQNISYYPPAYILYSETVSHLLLLTNSSVNFLIYCVVATRFRVFIKRRVMCNSRELTSNAPMGVARLVTEPLLVMTAVPHPEPIAIIPPRRKRLVFSAHIPTFLQYFIFT